MSYLDAPQTRMLATHCCACGRPLCDARSVELGIGPECGEHLHSLLDDELGVDQRRLANQLVHAAAVYAQQGRIGEVRRCADAIAAIGLGTLATTIRDRFRNAERDACIMVARHMDRIRFKTPFRRGSKDEFLSALRKIPGRKYDGDGVNSVPVEKKAELWRFLIEFFPGKYGESDEGLFRVPGGEQPAGEDVTL